MPKQLFSKRERIAIAGATVAFILISAAVHFALGGAISKWIVIPRPQPEPSAIEFRHFRFESPTPTPRPAHTPTPPPKTHARREQSKRTPPYPTQTMRANPPAASPSAGPVEPSASPSGLNAPLPTDTESPVPQASPSHSISPIPSDIREGAFLKRVVPSYPPVCIAQGAGGTVVIEITIESDGSVAAARVGQTSGYSCLDEAALAAAKESTYRPPELNGKPVSETYRIVYDFAIDS
jgi:protein TonB